MVRSKKKGNAAPQSKRKELSAFKLVSTVPKSLLQMRVIHRYYPENTLKASHVLKFLFFLRSFGNKNHLFIIYTGYKYTRCQTT